MTVIFEDFNSPCGGTPPSSVEVTLVGPDSRPIQGRQVSSQASIVGTSKPLVDALGFWQCDLVPMVDIIPSNVAYEIRRYFGCYTLVSYISVPASGGPFPASQLEVDVMNSIAPSQLLSHASDLDLHGGGIELDYAELTSNVIVTGTGTNAAVVPALSVNVPDISRPVHLYAMVNLSAVSGVVTGSAVITPWDGVATTVGFLVWKDVNVRFPTANSPNGEPHLFLEVRLPPNSPGLYAVAARSATTPFSIRVDGSSFVKSTMYAIAR